MTTKNRTYGMTGSTYGGRPASVVGRIETSIAGNLILRVGQTVETGGWTQTEHVVMTAAEALAFADAIRAAITEDQAATGQLSTDPRNAEALD